MSDLADRGGARGSNTGDQFHELWALGQVLALLEPNTDLLGVKVEGVEGKDKDKAWEGVDCTLFRGGSSLETARSVEMVQLKYSGTPDESWTVARLSATKTKGRNNSVLRRLADASRKARERMPPSSSLAVRLVSNRALDDEVLEILRIAAEGGRIAAPYRKSVDDIRRATGLEGRALSAFLEVLDFSGCGCESRFRHVERLILAVARLIEDNSSSDIKELQGHVRNLMLPERHLEVVTVENVLTWFGLADRSGLFPCPADMQHMAVVKDFLIPVN